MQKALAVGLRLRGSISRIPTVTKNLAEIELTQDNSYCVLCGRHESVSGGQKGGIYMAGTATTFAGAVTTFAAK